MLCISNNFQHVEEILSTSEDNSVLQIPLKIQVDQIKIIRVLLLAWLKNAVLKQTHSNV